MQAIKQHYTLLRDLPLGTPNYEQTQTWEAVTWISYPQAYFPLDRPGMA